ncbi:MAG TPA: CapA family protein [Bacteroidales bacterium]|jgi:poly-gamma-glutamate synthesis protein (capsule biosynthesis protein)|nr:CapA family protein [Bacteroidales bacterium]OQB61207.1 MAG: Capsule biosynthesis protein CapA [Bacteroidetes bacterium ADurb.Bin145]HOU02259.1 CapA family protein [Bacteroidales bacterium]HQG62256.1 CapA family protein [Bacteroidales bacterium]HQK68581.1 CapA family protein [Bacteroidales bacterium]
MQFKTYIAILLFFKVITLQGQLTGSYGEKITLLFIGDIMGHDTQIWSAENRETRQYDYNDVFDYIRSEISETDLSFANLEVTLAGPPYKGYPQFSSPAALAVACRNAGVDCLVTANNHSIDRGLDGINRTIMRLDSIGMPHTGTFVNSSARDSLQPLILKSNGISLALLNYTYGTNGIRIPEPAIVNMLNKDLISSDIEKAKLKKPDIIVLSLHWGTEYDTIPSREQALLADYFFSKGVDLIIGSHPHVLQKMVWYRNGETHAGKALVYSLGNFVSNQRKPKTDGGAMVRIEMTRQGGSFKVSESGYYLTWVYTPVVNYRTKFYILPCSKFEDKPEFFSKPEEYQQMKKFITDSRRFLKEQNLSVNEYLFKGDRWTLSD